MKTNALMKLRKVYEIGTLVSDGTKFGVVNKEGEVVVPCEMDAIFFYADLDYCFFEKDGLYGVYAINWGYVGPKFEAVEGDGTSFYGILNGKKGMLKSADVFVEDDSVEIEKIPVPLKEIILDEYESCNAYGREDLNDKEVTVSDGDMLRIFGKKGGYEIVEYKGY